MEEPRNDEIDLRDLLFLFWRYKWLVAVVFAVVVAAAALYAYSQPNQYRARAVIQYAGMNPVVVAGGEKLALENLLLTPLEAEEVASFIKSGPAPHGSPVSAKLLTGPASESQQANQPAWGVGLVGAGLLGDSRRIELTTTGADRSALEKALSQRIETANRFVTEHREAKIERAVEAIDASIDFYDQQRQQMLQKLQQQPADQPSAVRPAYQKRLVDIEAALATLRFARRRYQQAGGEEATPLRVLEPPKTAERPVGPRRPLYLMLGGMAGLFVAVMMVLLAESIRTGSAAR